jgi:3'-phosphoadenosine 5'-phosphosulfate sulfotransferase (PAPS reductase)/FAD synthetase
MADLMGIDRRVNKSNADYQSLQMGVIPSGSKRRLDRLNGVLLDNNGEKSQFNMEKYKFTLDAPFNISDKCCDYLKKAPSLEYEKMTKRKPILATMATESKVRTQKWLQEGCNAFDCKRPHSKPMSFWTEQDVLLYIKENNLPICSVYGDVVVDYSAMGQCENQMSFADFGILDKERPLLKTTGCQRTGCVLCGFGCHLEKEPNRFQMLKETHPKFHNLLYVLKNNGVTYAESIDWVNEHGNMNIKY